MTKQKKSAAWLYFGGTFDPVHNGHVQSALSAAGALNILNVCFVPCHITPHKDQPSTSSVHRLAMLECAVGSVRYATKNINVHVEAYELRYNRPSFTLNTLQYLRQHHGPDTPLFWLIGMDSLATIDRWHGWQELLAYAHIAVVKRPGYTLPNTGVIGEWWALSSASIDKASALPSGKCIVLDTSEKDVSSTGIRLLLQQKQKCDDTKKQIAQLVPAAVADYIQQHKLYLTSDTE